MVVNDDVTNSFYIPPTSKPLTSHAHTQSLSLSLSLTHTHTTGFLSGDGAGFLHATVQEQRSFSDKLANDINALREQILQLETSVSQAVLAPMQGVFLRFMLLQSN
jgi:hypothetical protein